MPDHEAFSAAWPAATGPPAHSAVRLGRSTLCARSDARGRAPLPVARPRAAPVALAGLGCGGVSRRTMGLCNGSKIGGLNHDDQA